MAIDEVVLVDEQDNDLGTMEKMEAHTTGALHRAISVFIFNEQGEMLLQQRALGKYHSGGLWSNACCSHPYQTEQPADAAKRRLYEEMGITATLQFLYHYRYKANVGGGMTENEYDHIFTGTFSGAAIPNKHEVMSYKYVPIAALKKWMAVQPHEFTIWFRMILDDFLEKYLTKNS